MTKYLNPGPFSGPTSSGKMTDREYEIAVGALVWCESCQDFFKADHKCPEAE